MLVQHKIMALAIDINRYKSIIRTEEATKTACIEPFFRLLGWDFSNPLQVIPEFTADFGVKAGERVDYCMKDEDTVCLIVECKSIDVKLSEKHISQLYRYFSVTDPHYAVLTNGVDYQIFTDSIKQNIMDSKPIFEFSIFDLENISFEMLVTFLSNPHFVDGMDERDYKLSLLQANNASLSYLLDVYKTNLANSQVYYSDYSEDYDERSSDFIECASVEPIDINDKPIDFNTLQETMDNFYQQSLVSEANKAYSNSNGLVWNKSLSCEDKFWQAANQGCLGTRDYSILGDIFIKILKYFGLMLLGAVGVILIFSVILLVFN